MKQVRWTDNVCTVGGTCIHGYFTKKDLEQLFSLCPNAHFTPTFYHEKLGPFGFLRSELNRLDSLFDGSKSLADKELGYYFTFMEADGQVLLEYLKKLFPMVRKESC